jgi:hypothetical protein
MKNKNWLNAATIFRTQKSLCTKIAELISADLSHKGLQ